MPQLTAFFKDEIKRQILFLTLAAVSLLLSFFELNLPGVDSAWVAIILCGVPIVIGATIAVVTEYDITADLLVSLALIASVAIGEIFAAGEIAFIMNLGALLEELTVAKARAGIEKLVNLTPRTARLITLDDGGQGSSQELIIPAETVKIGNILRVLPGETIPADGVITAGNTAIDQSIMTGESLPVDKSAGSEVFAGTINQFGSFDMEATQVGEDSSLQRMIKLVNSADAGKAKVVRTADRWATYIVIIALTAAAITYFATGQIIRAVTILVVFCPCALVLATPTAIMAAIGNSTKRGILVREGDALERLAKVKHMAFDKTGTLTYGKPELLAVTSVLPGYSNQDLFHLLASAETRSEHPLAKTIVKAYSLVPDMSRGTSSPAPPLTAPSEFSMLPGRGVRAVVNGHTILAGNTALLAEHNTHTPITDPSSQAYQTQGATIVYLAVNGQYAGFAALADTLRPTSSQVIAELKSQGITPVLLTGDHLTTANHIASQAGITEIKADCLPEAKMDAVGQYQKAGKLLGMVGDGVNDAPALKAAHVGIAMGQVGSDIAVEAADIVLVSDDIDRISHLIALSRRMMNTITINMLISMGINLAATILAALGLINPVIGALVHNCGSLLVIANSALLLRWGRHLSQV